MKKKQTHLTKKQLQSIGYQNETQIPKQYWYPQMAPCFKTFNSQGQNRKNLQNQTYKQFMKMDLSGPNEKGTGRFQFSSISEIRFSIIERKKINLVQLQQNSKKLKKNLNSKKQKLKDKKTSKVEQQKLYKQNENKSTTDKNFKQTEQVKFCISQIEQLLISFFQIPVSYNKQIKLSIDSQTNKLIDEAQLIEYQIQQKTLRTSIKNKNRKLQRPTYDVWKLIDLGIEYKNLSNNPNQNNSLRLNQSKRKTANQNSSAKHSVYLFLIEADLLEDDNQVDGRATGDGVAFISFTKQDFRPINLSKQFLNAPFPCYTLPILIHQCLHTLGFDHCSAWECLMNSMTNDELLLCPCCIRKFESQIEFKIDLKQWYFQLHSTLKKIKQHVINKYGNDQCPRMFADILYSKNSVKKNLFEVKNHQKHCENQQSQKSTFSMFEKCQFICQSLQIQNLNLN